VDRPNLRAKVTDKPSYDRFVEISFDGDGNDCSHRT
jgi:hypothetical protein